MGALEIFPVEERLEALPVLPMVVARLLSLDASADDYFDEVVELVGLEPTYAARLMIAANSVENRGRSEIRNIRDAVVRLGAKSVSSLVVSLSVVRVFVPRTPLQRSLWLHAVEVACGARALARVAGDRDIDVEQVYLAGLMHDMGHFLILDSSPEEMARVEESGWEKRADFVVAEREVFGFSHAELGALAARRWGLPENVAAAIRFHHDPRVEARTGRVPARVTQLVQATDLAMFDAIQRGEEQMPFVDDDAAQARLGAALPDWFPPLSPRVVERIGAAQAEAEAVTKTLGL